MQGYRKKLAAIAVTASTAGAITFGAVTAASAAPAAQPKAWGTESFQIVSTSASSDKSTIIATGVFAVGGVDHSGNKVDKVVAAGGTFKIAHSNPVGKQSLNPRTCVVRIDQHGTYQLGHGTGRFAGLAGHGKYRLKIQIVTARTSSGKCSEKKAPVAFEQIITGRGPARL